MQHGRPGLDPWVGKIPWRREQLPTPVFWPGECHGRHSPQGRKESDTTARPSISLEYGTHRDILYANRFLMKWCRKSHLPNKMRSDGGLKINASVWFTHNCFCTFGAQLNSESPTAEGWVNSPNPRRKNLALWPSLPDCLHLDHWSRPSLFVKTMLRMHVGLCVYVCVCVCVCLGSFSLHMKKITKAKTILHSWKRWDHL